MTRIADDVAAIRRRCIELGIPVAKDEPKPEPAPDYPTHDIPYTMYFSGLGGLAGPIQPDD